MLRMPVIFKDHNLTFQKQKQNYTQWFQKIGQLVIHIPLLQKYTDIFWKKLYESQLLDSNKFLMSMYYVPGPLLGAGECIR